MTDWKRSPPYVMVEIDPPAVRVDELAEVISRRLYARLQDRAATPNMIRQEAEAVYREIDRERFELGLPERPNIFAQAKFEVNGNRLDVLIPQANLMPFYRAYLQACRAAAEFVAEMTIEEWFAAGMPQ